MAYRMDIARLVLGGEEMDVPRARWRHSHSAVLRYQMCTHNRVQDCHTSRHPRDTAAPDFASPRMNLHMLSLVFVLQRAFIQSVLQVSVICHFLPDRPFPRSCGPRTPSCLAP